MSHSAIRQDGLLCDGAGTPVWIGKSPGAPSSDQSGGKAAVQVSVEASATAGPILRVSLDTGSTWAGLDPQLRGSVSSVNAAAIPVKFGGNVHLTTAGAETRTLAVPGYVGQTLTLYFQTDGGDCVITVASAINQAGNTVVTMNDAGDSITLRGVFTGAAMVWRVLANDGCALS